MMVFGKCRAGIAFEFKHGCIASGDYQSSATLCTFLKISDGSGGVAAVTVGRGSHGSHDNTVFKLHAAYAAFFKKK